MRGVAGLIGQVCALGGWCLMWGISPRKGQWRPRVQEGLLHPPSSCRGSSLQDPMGLPVPPSHSKQQDLRGLSRCTWCREKRALMTPGTPPETTLSPRENGWPYS